MDEIGFVTLTDLSQCCVRAASIGGSIDRGPYGLRRSERTWELNALIRQRRSCHDPDLRKDLSKAINHCSKKQLRNWRLSWASPLLERFRNTKYLQKVDLDLA